MGACRGAGRACPTSFPPPRRVSALRTANPHSRRGEGESDVGSDFFFLTEKCYLTGLFDTKALQKYSMQCMYPYFSFFGVLQSRRWKFVSMLV